MLTFSPDTSLVIDVLPGSELMEQSETGVPSIDATTLYRDRIITLVTTAILAEPLRPDRDADVQQAIRDEVLDQLGALFTDPKQYRNDMRVLGAAVLEHAPGQSDQLFAEIRSTPGFEDIGVPPASHAIPAIPHQRQPRKPYQFPGSNGEAAECVYVKGEPRGIGPVSLS